MRRDGRPDPGSREGLYKALAADGNPSFATVLKVLAALDLRIHVGPAQVA